MTSDGQKRWPYLSPDATRTNTGPLKRGRGLLGPGVRRFRPFWGVLGGLPPLGRLRRAHCLSEPGELVVNGVRVRIADVGVVKKVESLIQSVVRPVAGGAVS